MVQRRHIAYAIDVAMIGVVAHLAMQHPAVATVQQVGFWNALKSLPTPLNPVNASGFFIPTDRAPTAAEVTTQEWFNYVLGEDLGSAQARYPELAQFQATNKWKNSLILPAAIRDNLPHTIAVWARNMLAGWLLYFGVGFAWAFAIYNFWGSRFFPAGLNKPAWEDMRLQMAVSARALIFYTLAPTIGEWLIEHGWTHTYQDLSFIKGSFGGFGDLGNGLVGYALYTVLYFLGVEWGIYWVHRLLHHPNLYWLHRDHHIYNKENTLSPFAGLAFNPLDGLLQASPYILGLFLMPVHFWTHEIMLFFTAVWTTNIHDALQGDTEPIMGSAYHTLHHTKYVDNYGQILVLWDWAHETLQPPEHRRAEWGWKTPRNRDDDVEPGSASGKGEAAVAAH